MAEEFGTADVACAAPAGVAARQLATNTPGCHATVVPREPLTSEGYAEGVWLYLYPTTDDSPYGQSVACSLPDAELCAAALDHFLTQRDAAEGMPEADRERLTNEIRDVVHRRLAAR